MTLKAGQTRTKTLPDGTVLRVQLTGGALKSGQKGRGKAKAKVTPKDYTIVKSGDPEAPWELRAPDGRTVEIAAKKSDLRGSIAEDIHLQTRQGNPRYV